MLNKNQIRHLKALGHQLRPLVLMGANGLNDNVHREIDRALQSHELVKVKLSKLTNEQQRALIDAIVARSGGEFIQQIGHVALFFRRNKKEPKIELPRK